ncbi:unnamed protein product [Dovyalis caffra]|uniref:Uncharacterized protein n=1 Tax=Dovyalis caffra TaxID=77055 RepID=A0AAV1S102_9ROSI|nr:unnamed protein product [Dovyalis caffra]
MELAAASCSNDLNNLTESSKKAQIFLVQRGMDMYVHYYSKELDQSGIEVTPK